MWSAPGATSASAGSSPRCASSSTPDEVEITWRSFQLNPDAPDGAVPTLDYLARRFGPQAKAMTARVADLARAEGLELNFDPALSVNTFDAHRAIHLATDHGTWPPPPRNASCVPTSPKAPISPPPRPWPACSARSACDRGRRPRASWPGTEYADAVRADVEEAYALGATGVPFFVIDRTYGIPGAQPAEVFLGALRKAYAGRD